jgi:DNA-binding MarR family transcriptional regulator
VTTEPDPSYIPAMLRGARGAYAAVIAAMLTAAGFDDLPRNGPFVLGGMANQGDSVVDLIRGLGVSRQAASQLIDVLVLRGYLDRQVNPDDRRRLDVTLTDRGRAAAVVIRAAVEDVHRQLTAAITPAELDGLQAGLAALAAIKRSQEASREAAEEPAS